MDPEFQTGLLLKKLYARSMTVGVCVDERYDAWSWAAVTCLLPCGLGWMGSHQIPRHLKTV